MKKKAGEGGAKQNVGCWRIDPGEAKKKCPTKMIIRGENKDY